MHSRLLVPALFAIGCGTVNPSLVDGNPGGDSGSPVTVTSITPSDGATKVGVLSPIVIQLSGDADAASVTRTSVQLTWGDSKRVLPAAVTYDASAHTITLAPAAALQTGVLYKVALDGVTGGGGAVAATSAHFRTVYNPTLSYGGLDTTGKLTSFTEYGHNADGTPAFWAAHSAGSDGMYNTADDVRTSYVAWSYPRPNVGRRIYSTAAGPDGLWGTADDLYTGYVDITNGPAGMISDDSFDLGPDGKLDTADDVATAWYHEAYDSMDRWSLLSLGTPGPDGKIGTGDDVTTTEDRYTWASSTDVNEVDYGGAGADGVWHTADDPATSFYLIHYDDSGVEVSITFGSSGADNLYGTADDKITGMTTYDHDSHGLVTGFESHSGAGADGQWNTADDVIVSYYKYAHDGSGNLTEYAGYNLGADGKAFTADDYKSYTEKHEPTL